MHNISKFCKWSRTDIYSIVSVCMDLVFVWRCITYVCRPCVGLATTHWSSKSRSVFSGLDSILFVWPAVFVVKCLSRLYIWFASKVSVWLLMTCLCATFCPHSVCQHALDLSYTLYNNTYSIRSWTKGTEVDIFVLIQNHHSITPPPPRQKKLGFTLP